MLHVDDYSKLFSGNSNNKTHLTLMFQGKNMDQLTQDRLLQQVHGETDTNHVSKKRLPSNESDKSIKKSKEDDDDLLKDPSTNAGSTEVDDMSGMEMDDMFACLLLCAVLDQNSTKIKRRREFWRQNKPPHGLKLESRYLSITGQNPLTVTTPNSLVSSALAVNAFSTGSLASSALKKSLESIRENVNMSRNLALPQSFRNAASVNKCKNYSQTIGGLRLSAVPDLSSINSTYPSLNQQYLAQWNTPSTSSSTFYPAALTASVASEMSLAALPYSSTSAASMSNLAAITNLPGCVGLSTDQAPFRFAPVTQPNSSEGLNPGIWPIQQSPVTNMVPFQIPSIKLESPRG